MRMWLPVLVAAVLLAACGSAPPVPEDQFYRLRVTPAPSPGQKLLPGTVEIDRFVADGLTAGRPIVYSESGKPYQVREYHYHFWTQPPTVMLRDELVAFLRAAKVADAVVTPEMRVPADFVLTGKISRLEKVVGEPPKAVLEMELAVRKAAGGKLVFLDTYRIESTSDGAGVDDTVNALNQALATIYRKFLSDLAKR
jgi:cholesterol transport system auxiliary component